MKKLFLLSTSLTLLSVTAFAQDHEHEHHHHHNHDKNWSVHVDSHTYITEIYDADDADEEISDIFSHAHIDGTYNFNAQWSLNGSVVLEGDPAGHAHGGGTARTGNRFFDDHPLIIQQLTLHYDDNHYGIYGGKFNPHIGIDNHHVPGWMGYFTFEEFDIREKIGVGGYGELAGQRLDISTYFADTTLLQESALYDRPTIDGEDKGVSNTEDFSSFSAQLSGDIIDDASYYIGYAHQGNDAGNDENRFTLGVNGHADITNALSINGMIDVTDISHLNGEADHDRRYMTLGAGADYNNWVFGATYTHIENDSTDADEGQEGSIAQGSIGYNFGNGFGIDVGYQRTDEEGEVKRRVGSVLRYHADF